MSARDGWSATALSSSGGGEGREPRAERNAAPAWLSRLHRVTVALADAVEPRLVAEAVLTELRSGFGADGVALAELSPEGDALVMLGMAGYAEEHVRQFARLPLSVAGPLVDAVRSRAPLFFADLASCVAAYPHHAEAIAAGGFETSAAIPLLASERVLGVLGVRFRARRELRPEERALLLMVASQSALALDRARLLVEERAARAPAVAEEVSRREEVLLRNQKLHEAVALRDQFLAAAGHDLRTPLTALQLQLDLATRGAPGLAPLQKARRQADRLGRLVEQLLEVSLLGDDAPALQPASMDLAQLARELAGSFAEDAARAGCALELDLRGPIEGTWDRARLEQLVRGLIGNALKYGRGRPVRIAARAEAGRALLEVEDLGIGIAREDHERIFDRFERAAPGHFGGLGLGLWMGRQIARAHGGKLSVRSALSAGSLFALELPAAVPA